jgi:hypothetical protein
MMRSRCGRKREGPWTETRGFARRGDLRRVGWAALIAALGIGPVGSAHGAGGVLVLRNLIL